MGQDLSEKNIIAERTSILDLVSPHVALKQAGKYYKGLCPFHPDKNPSFVVNPERNTFYCFGCGAGGDIYSFFMKFNNLSFPQALEELARRAGVPLREGPRRKDPQKEEAGKRALALNQAVCRFYHRTLLEAPEAGFAREYLHKRGIGRETILAFSLGYAAAGWDRLFGFLQKRQGAAELASTLGLVIPRKGGGGFYDRFRNRLMFPIFNTLGQVLAFGGRALGDEEPKYMNSPESFLYHKGSVLYGLHRAQPSIRERDTVIIVEGYFDLLTLHQNGLQNAVAVLGTALTTGQIDILKRHTQNLVLVFDGDPAGKKASFRNLPELVQRGTPARVVYLPENEDPDSFLRERGAGAFEELLDRAPSLLDTFLRERTDGIRRGDPVDKKVSALRQVLPVIGSIPDRLAQGLRIQALAETIGIPELSVREELSKIRGARPRSQEKALQSTAQWPAEERLICQILMQFPTLLPRFLEAGVLESFKSAALGETIRTCAQQFRNKGTLNLAEVLPQEEDDPALFRLLSRLSCKEEFTEEQASTALDDSVRRLRKRSLKERLDALHTRIREADQSRQADLMRQLSLEMQRLLDEKKTLLC